MMVAELPPSVGPSPQGGWGTGDAVELDFQRHSGERRDSGLCGFMDTGLLRGDAKANLLSWKS